MVKPPFQSRGTCANPANRYDRIFFEADPEAGGDAGSEPTLVYRDTTRAILAENESPDVGFRYSLNPYRGCEHGCSYCYARPTHEYLSFSAGLDFERRILVKEDAPELLRKQFESPRWKPETIALSGNTDCYQPLERRLRVTRRCLEVFCEFRNPVGIVTKSALVTRDIDLLSVLASFNAVYVFLSVTSLDAELARRMEPRAATPERRLEAMSALSAAGIPVAVMVAPVIPGLNDSEIPAILAQAADAGAKSAAWALLRLPRPVDDLFVHWLDENYPNRKDRVLGRIRQCRSGQLSDARFGHRMRGEGPYAQAIQSLFSSVARKHGLDRPLPPLNTAAFVRRPARGQLALF